MITNVCYANDITMLATSEAELQELVDRLDRVIHKYRNKGERDNARNNVRCTQARKTTHSLMDNIKTWTGLTMEESIRMA